MKKRLEHFLGLHGQHLARLDLTQIRGIEIWRPNVEIKEALDIAEQNEKRNNNKKIKNVKHFQRINATEWPGQNL